MKKLLSAMVFIFVMMLTVSASCQVTERQISTSGTMYGLGSILPLECIITTTPGAIYLIEADVLGSDNGANTLAYKFWGYFKNTGGVVQPVGLPAYILKSKTGSMYSDARFICGIYGLISSQIGMSLDGPSGVFMEWFINYRVTTL